MKKVTIVGSGFAALTAIKTLRKSSKNLDITVVSPKAEVYYLPGTIWIPCELRKPSDLTINLDNFFSRMKVNHISAKATGLTDNGRTLQTTEGDIKNDALIICSGGQFIKKLSGIDNAITPCEGIPATVKIRDRLQSMQGGTIAFGFSGNPKEPSAMRGGPMFEFLFGIDCQLRKEGRRDKFNLIFFTPSDNPGQRLGPKAVDGLLKEMKKRNIKTHLGHKMKQFTDHSVNNTELPRSQGGMIKANRYCQVEGFDKVYVAGDSGSYPGPGWMPKQAHMADLQAEAAAKNLLNEFDNQPAYHSFKIELLCIVDSQNSGMLVLRNDKLNLVLPRMRIFHWLKRFFEWFYLRQYK